MVHKLGVALQRLAGKADSYLGCPAMGKRSVRGLFRNLEPTVLGLDEEHIEHALVRQAAAMMCVIVDMSLRPLAARDAIC